MKKELIVSHISIFFLGLIIGAFLISPQLSPPLLEERVAEAKIVAVRSSDNIGVIGKVRVQIIPGSGRVLITTNPFIEPDTQYSAETAVRVASEITGEDLSKYDVIFDFRINGSLLGGPSAGAAMTVVAIAAIENASVRDDAVITGTIEGDGSIGDYEKVVEERSFGGIKLYEIRYVPAYLNLSEYMSSYGLQVVEVSNIQEAMSYLLVRR